MCLFIGAQQAFADSVEQSHVRSAFLFAESKTWNEAISHARAAKKPILVKYFIWSYLKDPESDAPFQQIRDFIQKNPEWPDRDALERRAEVAVLTQNFPEEAINDWFSEHAPKTSMAKLKISKDRDSWQRILRSAWVNDDYSKATESKFLDQYASELRSEDHIARIERLLWEGKNDAAKRVLYRAPYDYQRLFQARLLLSENKENASMYMVNVAPALRHDTGLLYEEIRQRIRDDDKEGVRQLLLKSSGLLPYPEKWWPLFERQIRSAIAENNLTLAEKLLERHGQKEDSSNYIEAEWLRGWFELEYLKKPDDAYKRFLKLLTKTDNVRAKTRICYWLGRSAEKGKRLDAKNWYAKAAKYPTLFYGQLALWELNPKATFDIHSTYSPTIAEKEQFRRSELVQLVYALGQANQSDLAEKFIIYLTENSRKTSDIVMATTLGHEIRRIDYGVRASKKALQKDVIVLSSGYPVINITTTTDLEKPLLLGLIRQESEFFADAVSPSGAHGLMQLLPGTAKETARKNRVKYSAHALSSPSLNTTLGSLYLKQLLERFNGSYVLSIASYNAGLGRVRGWLRDYGEPGQNMRNVINWIEQIPTTETRRYVQHVIENTEVYRFVLAGSKPVPLHIEEDLVW